MMRVIPIINKKLRAKILIVGWRSTKLLIAEADRIITTVEARTAAIITVRLSTIPTAVITESREKTMSSKRI